MVIEIMLGVVILLLALSLWKLFRINEVVLAALESNVAIASTQNRLLKENIAELQRMNGRIR